MKIRTRFALLFAAQAVLLALFSIAFVFNAVGGGSKRAENELAAVSKKIEDNVLRSRDVSLNEKERLSAALAAMDGQRAAESAGRVFRTQAIVESVASVALFVLGVSAASILLVTIAARPLTRRLDELSAGAATASADRLYRFPSPRGGEFAPVYGAFNSMLDLIAEQEARLLEAARLEGWKEVSSFLFHQLRAPLAAADLAGRNVEAILARSSEGVLDTGEAGALIGARAAAIRKETERMRNLLDRFKKLSGLSLREPTCFTAAELIAACSARIPEDRCRVEPSGDVDAAVRADRGLLEEALMNLLCNAVEACAEPPALVRVSVQAESGSIALTVTDDNGPVDPGIFERLGKERFTTKSEGTGLGLLFVRRVAALHGGTLRIERASDGGFAARLTIPEGGSA